MKEYAKREAKTPVARKEEGFGKMYRENWEYVYNIAFAICYDDDITRRTAIEMFYTLGRLVGVKKRAFNSNEWMQSTVTRICAGILHKSIKEELKAYDKPAAKDEDASDESYVDFNWDRIVKLCEDPAVNDECFRNLSIGEKTALSLLCVHDMSLDETANFLKIKKTSLEILKQNGIMKIAAALNLFGKISFPNS